jgi:hypothetical protein
MKEIEFVLICNCKMRLNGYLADDDYKEELTCSHCGLVWVIPRPYEGEEQTP